MSTKNAAARAHRALTLPLPQTDDQADTLVLIYGETFNAIARLQADCDDAIAALKREYEGHAKPLQEQLKTTYAQLSAWGSAHRDRLTEKGKSKTVQLPAGTIGWRNRPPSVRWAKGLKIEDVLVAIKKAGLKRFIRTKEEPNKERMLDEPEIARTIDGIIIGPAGEDFFVAPFGAELSEPKQ